MITDRRIAASAFTILSLLLTASLGGAQARRALAAGDVEDIARLLMLEDRRTFDDTALTRILGSPHPEVRRRAVLAIGRIADPRGRALLVPWRGDQDAAVVAAMMLAVGQLRDSAAIEFLASTLTSAQSVPVAREAARSLGKIQTADARSVLARYLATAPATPATMPVVGEALLSIGRFTMRADLAPIVRWTTSPDTAIRWRAAWALMRPRDPRAVMHLVRLSEDTSAEVRFWSVRGLTAPLSDSAGVDRARMSARLRAAVADPDRRVRTEALRALATYDDDSSVAVVLAALDSPDSWMSVTATEALGRFRSRAETIVPRLLAAAASARSLAQRITALTSLTGLESDHARSLASSLATDSSTTARQAAAQALRRLDSAAAARGGAPPSGRGGGAPPNAARRQGADSTLTIEHYRRIAERWVVPDYNGAPNPRAVWETPRGTIELELYTGDAPLATDYFVRVVESGAIVGTEFGRVVPNFVAQQRTILNAAVLRDEVNLRGLTRGNLSWASAGLDTGRPGYTLGSTPQPHNEGDFTSLGRVVRGMDVVDRLELGDRVIAARMVR